ncbi:LysR family transcriptional regulator [Parvibium lacunae]|uniref:LysR family transcriptional regulator n=1 Tax=Parvibium lacunae TaxID=1888893 RepID=A0A368KYN2_9BURK|nr:LysR family transcriptional regulator [Parvibium lacunae]RCS56538.1 LysR family transcriptional regulator [Parvibium lacunae]
MESKWLEDFVSLAETRSFSKAAAARNVTQPAFSRRIQALEAWVGAELIDRSAYPTRLTEAGELFYGHAVELLAQVGQVRSLLRGQRADRNEVIDFAVPHNLSLTFFPKWLTELEHGYGRLNTRLVALNVHDAVMNLVEGNCDFVLCYHHARLPVKLDPVRYEMLLIGKERLQPYSRSNEQGKPYYLLPGVPEQKIPFLSYTQGAYLGKMVDLILADSSRALYLDKLYETDMAEGLKAMALEGHGVAFLPGSAVTREVAAGHLALAGEGMVLDMEIRLYRERPTPAQPGKASLNALWAYLSRHYANS